MARELANGCTDKRLIDWSECAWAHEVTHSTSMTVINSKIDKPTSDRVGHSDIWNKSGLINSEGLFVSFNTFGEYSKTCLLLTALDLVLVYNDYDEGWEFFAEMTHQQFWDYLGSFPNVYKHSISTACNRGGYWLINKPNNQYHGSQ